jgi:hypothetical protein
MTYSNALESSNRSTAPVRRNGDATLAQKAIFFGQLGAALSIIFVIGVALTVQAIWHGIASLFSKGGARRQKRGSFRVVW